MHHFYSKRLTISMDNKMKEEIQKYTLNISESSFVRIAISNYLSKIKEDGPIDQDVPSSIESHPDTGEQFLS